MSKDFNKLLVSLENLQDKKLERVIDKVEFLAKRFKASVELFTCGTDYAVQENASLGVIHFENEKEKFIKQQKALLEELAEPLRKKRIEVSVDAQWKAPFYIGVLEKAKEIDAQLIIKKVSKHHWLDEVLFTNVDWQLIRNSSIPLLFLKNKYWGEPPTIIASVDPSHEHDKPEELDLKILELSQLLSKKLGADLKVLHAVFLNAFAQKYEKQILQGKSDSLESLTKSFQLENENLYIEEGLASDVIPEFTSSKNVDILVMGAVSRSAVETIFIGNTAEQVLDEIKCDAFVVK